MPDIILLKNERGDFQLSNSLKVAIIIFACVCFALSPVCLARYKMSCREIQEGEVTSTMNEVKQRKGCFIWHILIQIFCINLPFLILLLIVWFDHGYEASIFIAKTLVFRVIQIYVMWDIRVYTWLRLTFHDYCREITTSWETKSWFLQFKNSKFK